MAATYGLPIDVVSVLAVWYIGSIVAGALLGVTAGLIFRKIVPPGINSRYWNSVGTAIHTLLYGDESDFWRSYKNVIVATIKYVSQQLVAVFAAFAPLVVIVFVFGPVVWSYWDRDASFAVFPQEIGQLRIVSDTTEAPSGSNRIFRLANNDDIAIPARAGSHAICAHYGLKCMSLQGLGFTATVSEKIAGTTTDIVIIRSSHDDWNPFWPYLNDPEFLLFLALSITSVVIILFQGRRNRTVEPGHGIGGLDFALTQVATKYVDTMCKVARFESRMNKKRFSSKAIAKPVFISGLARSGTTILLEKLSTINGVATHRYRDFPFIMTPIYWNRFLSVFGSRQEPVERPHKDAIKITRDSPDAFEEPIWQYFFGLPTNSLGILQTPSAADDEEFRQFFRQHIQKILLIRKGTRYVSKGNYNLLRMKYLFQLFPDALFLVPIRHPITHIESLARQHEIFCQYAREDPKVPAYLRAVGHFEFGPQRLPIGIDDAGAKATTAYWAAGDEFAGYAQQWSDVYRSVLDFLAANSTLAARVRIVHFESLCESPLAEMTSILGFVNLGDVKVASSLAQDIRPPSSSPSFDSARHAKAWGLVSDVAGRFGYSKDPADASHSTRVTTKRIVGPADVRQRPKR